MTDFLRTQGVLSLGSRLRALSDQLFKEGDLVYKRHGIPMHGRWFPVISLVSLSEKPISVTYIADQTGFSHPYVSTQAQKMIKLGYLQDERCTKDERRRLLSLTQKGEELIEQARPVWDNFKKVACASVENSGSDFLDAVERFEKEIKLRPWSQEVNKLMHDEVVIIDYDPQYKKDFARLNIEWLEKYFSVEAVDQEYFDFPEKKILQKGGRIFFAKLSNQIVGTCALFHEGDGVYELAKMGVNQSYQGKGVGAKLIEHSVACFKSMQGRELFLETHSSLQTAIRLYKKHGFVDQGHRKPGSVYARSEVYMVLDSVPKIKSFRK